ncbi:MAG: helix-turn-helix domain-containing protein [Acidimicrobiales bacterium]
MAGTARAVRNRSVKGQPGSLQGRKTFSLGVDGSDAALSWPTCLELVAGGRSTTPCTQGLSQTVVAARMGSSQSVVARIEQGDRDVRLSTLARYAAAVGRSVSWVVSEAKVS